MICLICTMLRKLYTACVNFCTNCVNLRCFVANLPLFGFTRFCAKFWTQNYGRVKVLTIIMSVITMMTMMMKRSMMTLPEVDQLVLPLDLLPGNRTFHLSLELNKIIIMLGKWLLQLLYPQSSADSFLPAAAGLMWMPWIPLSHCPTKKKKISKSILSKNIQARLPRPTEKRKMIEINVF